MVALATLAVALVTPAAAHATTVTVGTFEGKSVYWFTASANADNSLSVERRLHPDRLVGPGQPHCIVFNDSYQLTGER